MDSTENFTQRIVPVKSSFHEADDNVYQYMSLPCHWANKADDSSALRTIVHFKVAFNDIDLNNCNENDVLLRIYIMNATETRVGMTDIPEGLFKGSLQWKQVATNQQHLDGNRILVKNWMINAKVALLKDNDLISNDVEYDYRMERVDEKVADSLLFKWILLLKPFGEVTHGSIKLTRLATTMQQGMNEQFVTPLIKILAVQRLKCKQVNDKAINSSKTLLDDNKCLMHKLRIITDELQREDDRRAIKFLQLLNTKKKKLAEEREHNRRLKEELMKLKDLLQQKENSSEIQKNCLYRRNSVHEKEATTPKRRRDSNKISAEPTSSHFSSASSSFNSLSPYNCPSPSCLESENNLSGKFNNDGNLCKIIIFNNIICISEMCEELLEYTEDSQRPVNAPGHNSNFLSEENITSKIVRRDNGNKEPSNKYHQADDSTFNSLWYGIL